MHWLDLRWRATVERPLEPLGAADNVAGELEAVGARRPPSWQADGKRAGTLFVISSFVYQERFRAVAAMTIRR